MEVTIRTDDLARPAGGHNLPTGQPPKAKGSRALLTRIGPTVPKFIKVAKNLDIVGNLSSRAIGMSGYLDPLIPQRNPRGGGREGVSSIEKKV